MRCNIDPYILIDANEKVFSTKTLEREGSFMFFRALKHGNT